MSLVHKGQKVPKDHPETLDPEVILVPLVTLDPSESLEILDQKVNVWKIRVLDDLFLSHLLLLPDDVASFSELTPLCEQDRRE